MKSRIVQKKVNPMVAATSVTTQPVRSADGFRSGG